MPNLDVQRRGVVQQRQHFAFTQIQQHPRQLARQIAVLFLKKLFINKLALRKEKKKKKLGALVAFVYLALAHERVKVLAQPLLAGMLRECLQVVGHQRALPKKNSMVDKR